MSVIEGTLFVTAQAIETGDGCYYRVITDAKLDGAPLVRIPERLLYDLPDWAIALDGGLIQVGPYVLRCTGTYDHLTMSIYYYVVDGGLPYWLWWRMCRDLDFIWRRIILTLAVWGLSRWPREGTVPSWADVVRRWQR